MNQKEYRDLMYQLGYVNVGDPGVKDVADIIEPLLRIIRAQTVRIERLEQKLEAHIDRQAAHEFEGF